MCNVFIYFYRPLYPTILQQFLERGLIRKKRLKRIDICYVHFTLNRRICRQKILKPQRDSKQDQNLRGRQMLQKLLHNDSARSEERRVGKECRL